MLGEMASVGVYVWDTRAMNPLESRKKDDEDELAKKDTNVREEDAFQWDEEDEPGEEE